MLGQFSLGVSQGLHWRVSLEEMSHPLDGSGEPNNLINTKLLRR